MDPATCALDRMSADVSSLADLAGASGELRQHAASLPRIGIVRNLRSHRNKGSALDGPQSSGISVVTPRTRDEIESALERFADEGVGLLVIDGGDGTVRDVLTCGAAVFGNRWPRLIVLPKGKTNALAGDLGVPRKWTLTDALAAVKGGHVVRRRPLVIERAGPDQRNLWGFIFGAGAFNAAIETGQVTHRFGAFQSFAVGVTATLGLAQALFGIGEGSWRKTAPMRLTALPDGADLPHSGHGSAASRYLALFSTLHSFPLGMKPFRAGGIGIRYLMLDAPLRRVAALIPSILRGVDRPHYERLGIHRGAVDAVSIALDDRFILDGEAFAPGMLRLRQGPELLFIVP